jgi:hypothetical protein
MQADMLLRSDNTAQPHPASITVQVIHGFGLVKVLSDLPTNPQTDRPLKEILITYCGEFPQVREQSLFMLPAFCGPRLVVFA